MKKFVAHNAQGFANSWDVSVFESTETAKNFISDWHSRHPDRPFAACRIIKKSDATRFAGNWNCTRNERYAPKPFSGEYWGIVPDFNDRDTIDGLIGDVCVCDSDDPDFERVF